MKSRNLLAFIPIVLAAISLSAQSPYRGSKPDGSKPIPKAVQVLPDLVVTGMDSQKPNVVRIHISNQGLGTAKPCHLQFVISDAKTFNSAKNNSWYIAVPAIKAHQSYWAMVNIAPYTVLEHEFYARVDVSNEVAESNESNNYHYQTLKIIH